MPAAVLDTNLFIAAFWNERSASAQILKACLEGHVRLYHTREIRREIHLILRNIKASERYKREVDRILDSGTELRATGSLRVVADDPEDDKFLECARLACADYLVTNDDHLLRIGSFNGARIVRPSEFRRILRETSR